MSAAVAIWPLTIGAMIHPSDVQGPRWSRRPLMCCESRTVPRSEFMVDPRLEKLRHFGRNNTVIG